MENPQIPKRKSINKLVKKAFGNGFRGDFFWGWGGPYHCDRTSKGKDFNGNPGLGFIARRRPTSTFLIVPPILYIPYILFPSARDLFGVLEKRGKFTKQDGSELVVDERYLPQAERYAELYRSEIGRKNVEIRVGDI